MYMIKIYYATISLGMTGKSMMIAELRWKEILEDDSSIFDSKKL